MEKELDNGIYSGFYEVIEMAKAELEASQVGSKTARKAGRQCINTDQLTTLSTVVST
jgi:hypothetical protein